MRETWRKWMPMWRWVGGAALLFLILFLPFPRAVAAPVEHTFHVEASQFAYQPAVLAVNRGDKVTIELHAQDVVHGLSIDGYNLEITSDPGQTSRLTFVADRQGSFRFRCTVTCGNLHPFMIGKLHVERNDLLLRAGMLAVLAFVAGAWRLWR